MQQWTTSTCHNPPAHARRSALVSVLNSVAFSKVSGNPHCMPSCLINAITSFCQYYNIILNFNAREDKSLTSLKKTFFCRPRYGGRRNRNDRGTRYGGTSFSLYMHCAIVSRHVTDLYTCMLVFMARSYCPNSSRIY